MAAKLKRRCKPTPVKRKKVGHEKKPLSFLPTDMTRSCPFFPMPRNAADEDRQIVGCISQKHGWGESKIYGYRLSIYDEDLLYALLYLMKKYQTLSFTTTPYQICSIMGKEKCLSSYTAVWGSLRRLTLTGMELSVWRKQKEGRKLVPYHISTFLAGAEKDLETKKITISVNPFFMEMIERNLITRFDIRFRAMLKGDIAKALYRFLNAQKPLYASGNGKYKIGLLKLCQCINLMVEGVPLYQLRRQIKTGLEQLVKQGYLEEAVIRNDVVFVKKRKELRKKRLPDKKKTEGLWADLPNPLSREIYDLWKARFPKVELSKRQDWRNIVKAAEMLEQFREKYRDHFFSGIPINLAASAFDALEHSINGSKGVHTGYLVKDFFYDNILKSYLIETKCVMSAEKAQRFNMYDIEREMNAEGGQRKLYDENGDPVPEEKIISRC